MVRSIRKSTGDRVEIASCAAAHAVGDLVLENGFIGLCESTNVISGANTLIIRGRVRIKVPASTSQGQYLQLSNTLPAAATNGSLVANLTTCNAVAVAAATANTGTLVGQIMEAPVSNLADVELFPQQAGKR